MKKLDYNYIGADEAGKGEVFGPMVIAACYVPMGVQSELIDMGVKDSKTLSNSRITKLSECLYSLPDLDMEVMVLTPERYNTAYRVHSNQLDLLEWAYGEIIGVLAFRTGCKQVIVDNFIMHRSTDFKLEDPSVSVAFEYQADVRFVAAAAASILARASVLRWFRDWPALPLGSSLEAFDELPYLYAEGILDKVAKLHFLRVDKFLSDKKKEHRYGY